MRPEHSVQKTAKTVRFPLGIADLEYRFVVVMQELNGSCLLSNDQQRQPRKHDHEAHDLDPDGLQRQEFFRSVTRNEPPEEPGKKKNHEGLDIRCDRYE